MGSEKKRVAVIGAGCSGLVAIKTCVEDGLEPVCFERTDHLGGLWYFTEDCHEGQGSVARNTVINTSKEMMTYSDFPVPSEYANYMHNSKVLQYFRSYCEHFELEKYIRYQQEVSATPADDFATTGRWVLEVKDKKTGDVTKETFDAVMVCTGHHADTYMPKIEGDDVFEGRRIHTHDYKDSRGLEGKRVVVIGIGNSGADANIELSRICSQVYLSTRRGAWVASRVMDDGVPIDLVIIRRWLDYVFGLLPDAVGNAVWEAKLNSRFNHYDYGLKPKHRFNGQHPTLGDELPNRIACGSVIVKPDIRRLTARDVEFEDGTVAKDIDAVIYATGYNFGFPSVKHPALKVTRNKVNIYKYVYPMDLEKPTLAVIGYVQPIGAILPLSELQCRWATQVFKGTKTLPPKAEMMVEMAQKAKDMAVRYVQSQRHTIQVDFIPYTNEIAEQVGCKPDLRAMLLADPVLALKCFFGPCTPYQFRLSGPGKWHGARQAIMTQWDRIHKPLQTRRSDGAKDTSWLFYIGIFLIAAFVIRAALNLIL